MNNNQLYQRALGFAKQHMILIGVSSAIVIALLLVFLSMYIYVQSDVARLDVSRPGYESVREAVVKGDEQETKFDTAGVLDKEALDTFQRLFDERRQPLSNYGRFDGAVLNDDQLKLAAPPAPATE